MTDQPYTAETLAAMNDQQRDSMVAEALGWTCLELVFDIDDGWILFGNSPEGRPGAIPDWSTDERDALPLAAQSEFVSGWHFGGVDSDFEVDGGEVTHIIWEASFINAYNTPQTVVFARHKSPAAVIVIAWLLSRQEIAKERK